MKPHESIDWALTAWHLRENYLPLRRAASGAPSDADSFTWGITEAAVLLTVFELVRRIELRLKRRLANYLRRLHGKNWWQALPTAVQTSAAARHRWAVSQIGTRRAGHSTRTDWLSFGDIAKALRALSGTQWQACLSAETKKRLAFQRNVARVKRFRDQELAHPKPKRMTNHQLRILCTTIQGLPQVLCPAEWARVLTLLEMVTKLSEEHQRHLADDLNFHLSAKGEFIRKWLACPVLEPPEMCTHSTKVSLSEILWREAVLKTCAELDAGRRVFFSYGYPLPINDDKKTDSL